MTDNSKKRRIWPWIALGVLVVLLIGLRFSLRSDWFMELLRSQAEVRVSEMLDGELRIQRLDGDLWSHINVRNIRLYASDPPDATASTNSVPSHDGSLPDGQILALDSLHVSWSLKDVIFRRPLEIKKIHAAGLRADIIQQEDGTWNILDLIPPDPEWDEDEPGQPAEEDPGDPFPFVIKDIRLTAPEVFVDAKALLPGEPVFIRDFELQMRLGQDKDGFHAALHHLDLYLHESRLESPVHLATKASWDGRRVTLDKLLIAGAYTLLEASGSYDTATSASRLDALLDPLAWREAAAYAEEYPLRQDLKVRLEAGGSRQNLEAGIILKAQGLEHLAIQTRWSFMQEPVLTAFRAESGHIDAATLTGIDTLSASIGGFNLAFEGTVPLMEWDRVNLSGAANITDIRFDVYSVDVFDFNLAASGGRMQADVAVRKDTDEVTASLDARNWWDENIVWNFSWQMDDLRPGLWAAMEELNGAVTMRGSVAGYGYEPAKTASWCKAVHYEAEQYESAAGQDKTETGQDESDAGQGETDAGQGETDAGQDESDAGQDKTETGQDESAAGHYKSNAEPWKAEIVIDRLTMPDFPNLSAEIAAELTGECLKVNIPARLDGARLDLAALLFYQPEDQRYEATFNVSKLDASIFPGAGQLTTNINGSAEVSGRGFDLETMQLKAALNLIESEINRQMFESISMEVEVDEGIAYVENARLISIPATAGLSMRQNILDVYDRRNRLEFEMELLDLSGFANLAGADTLQVLGRLEGTMLADELGRLVLESSLNLHSLQLDTIRVEQVEGYSSAILADTTAFHADLEIRNPSFGQFAIRDISLTTDGLAAPDGISGSYDFRFNVESESGLRQQADYYVGDTLRIHTRELEITDPAGAYNLQQPFDVLLAEGLVQVDTLQLVSFLGSEISMALSKTPESPWEGFVSTYDTDLGQVQYVFLDEPLFEAIMSGRIAFRFDDDLLEVSGLAEVNSFLWGSTKLDSIRFALNVADHRLLSDAAVWSGGSLLVQSEFDLPFVLSELDDLDPDFFEEQVSGYFQINPVDITDFGDLLKDFGMERLSGIFSLQTTLGGLAGSPEMHGGMRLRNGMISGVAIDTLLLQWDYEHAKSELGLLSRIHSAGQKAADINGRVPLHLDFRRFEFDGPDPDDPVDFSIYTSALNLAAFNDFLDPALLRNLEGRLDADITVGGTIADPEMSGGLLLSGGQVRLVENNITLRRIRFDTRFAPEQITVREMTAQSVGSFNGRGEIRLDGFTPTEMDVDLTAINFRVFNTRDMEIYAGLNMKMTGSLEEPFLRGDVRWERGILYLDDFGQREIEEVFLDDEDVVAAEGPDFFDRMGMEVKFSVDRNAFVRNRRDPEINLALRGEVDLVKSPFEDLQLFGDMGVSSGHVTTFGKRFQLERGNVMFSGDPMEPELDIRTLFQPRQQYEDIRIYYTITGTLSEPEFAYSSEPEMELQDIISYTLFGRPFHALAGWEQTMSGQSNGSMAANIALDILLDRIETLASDRLGIDVIEIENTRRGGGGTSIKAGKFISDRLFIAFLQELGGTDAGRQVIIEYLLRRNLELIITAGDDYRSGVDVLWRFDY